jgi:dihydroxyacetone kinase-like protein
VSLVPGDRLSLPEVRAWLAALTELFAAKRTDLDTMDAAIGDGDHGTTMARGLGAVPAATAGTYADIGALLQQVGRTLLKIGGATGPLFGTLFIEAGSVTAGMTTLAPADVAHMLSAASRAVQNRGGANAGNKTMVDALQPAAEAATAAAAAGASLERVVAAAADAANAGAVNTRSLVAHQGRARFLGERSAGHQDPGATSVALLLEALLATIRRAEGFPRRLCGRPSE